ncbi:hypothetical protein H5T51_05545 [Candidatus Bathyarchaeota archaeon]|nr:hypothetical protein [Candidatus Bathyarchaeota archaeon]
MDNVEKEREKHPANCTHYFGYLGKRRGKEVPEECISCKKVVECMLHTLKVEFENEEKEKITEEQFTVKNLGILYAAWKSTARIPEKILKKWGKVKEVEVKATSGIKVRCKVVPIKGVEETEKIIELPDNIQRELEVSKGEKVSVKPHRKTAKMENIILNTLSG